MFIGVSWLIDYDMKWLYFFKKQLPNCAVSLPLPWGWCPFITPWPDTFSWLIPSIRGLHHHVYLDDSSFFPLDPCRRDCNLVVQFGVEETARHWPLCRPPGHLGNSLSDITDVEKQQWMGHTENISSTWRIWSWLLVLHILLFLFLIVTSVVTDVLWENVSGSVWTRCSWVLSWIDLNNPALIHSLPSLARLPHTGTTYQLLDTIALSTNWQSSL